LSRVFDLLVTSPSADQRFGETLFSLALALRCHPEISERLATSYPQAYAHGDIVSEARQSTTGNSQLRLALAQILCREIVNLQVLNRRLFNSVALFCQNADERRILNAIRASLASIRDAA
jgi:hypothetical protein